MALYHKGAIMGGKRIEVGEKFSSLTAVEQTYKYSKSGRKRSHWLCICECGGSTVVDGGNLRNGNTRWCSDCASKWKSTHRATHGQTRNKKPTKSYMTWAGMKSRVFNENDARYSDYGGWGIDMSPKWENSFEAFYADMGDPPSKHHQIDRMENDKGYWPDNCKWATITEQGNNKRNNIILSHLGKTQTLAEWSRELGINYEAAQQRYYKYPDAPDVVLSVEKLSCGPTYKVSGTAYDSLSKVAKVYGMSVSGCHARFNSDTYPSWVKVQGRKPP